MDVTALDLTKGLAGVGSVGLVLWALTQLGEKWAWYQALSRVGKQVLAAALSSVVALTAWSAVTFLPDSFWQAIQAPFSIVASIVGTIGGANLIHFLTNKWGPTIQAQAQGLKAIQAAGTVLLPAENLPPQDIQPPSAVASIVGTIGREQYLAQLTELYGAAAVAQLLEKEVPLREMKVVLARQKEAGSLPQTPAGTEPPGASNG